MQDLSLRFRQIHLDFHTSEHVVGIGSQFDPDEFADTLVNARVNSITCFARCHHGWIYYDSKKHPKHIHPHLSRNLLKEQIEACHARGIRVPIYTTIQWDHLISREHPQCLTIGEDGKYNGNELFEAGFYQRLAVNSPYIDYLKDHIKDIFESVPVDGFFFDIVSPVKDSSIWTRTAMLEDGLDPTNSSARLLYGDKVINDFRRELSDYVRQFSDDCTIFYNNGHVGPDHRQGASAYTHFELESLPSGHWGYIHFPLSARYARTLDKPLLGHTGKFHTAWGDFHSFKNQEALEYECFRMMAHGVSAMIGDQLPPNGKIEEHVYHLIGNVYRQIEQKEAWCINAKAKVDIGVLTPEEFGGVNNRGGQPSICGVHSMLQESAHQFDIIDSHANFSDYKVIILPDNIPVNSDLKQKIDAYIAEGGAVIASFESGMNAEKTEFILDALAVTMVDEGPRDRFGNFVRGVHYERGDYAEYIVPEGLVGQGLPQTEHVMYIRGMAVEAKNNADILAHITPSQFDRTYQHFCSHRQTPSSGETAGPAIVKNGQVIYFSSPIFSQYYHNAPRWCRTMFLNMLDSLLPNPLVSHEGPSTLEMMLNQQTSENRDILHILHYIPIRRSAIDIIEDVIPVYNIPVSIRADKPIQSISLAPSGETLAFDISEGRALFTVPEINGHQMIEINY